MGLEAGSGVKRSLDSWKKHLKKRKRTILDFGSPKSRMA
jgi:hypothetical protein